MSEVWVVDFSVSGPEHGDYDGWQSVHASRQGAINRLYERFIDVVVWAPGPFTVIGAQCENGGFANDFDTGDGIEVSYAVHRMPVEP